MADTGSGIFIALDRDSQQGMTKLRCGDSRRPGHFTHDRFCVADAVSLRDPGRSVMRKRVVPAVSARRVPSMARP